LHNYATYPIRHHSSLVILNADLPKLSRDFIKFNTQIGNPILPETGERTKIFGYQDNYFQKWQTYHKLILNKSRKIGATETALRIIAYNCLHGRYFNKKVMIVAGNKQEIANKFMYRFKSLFHEGFKDKNGKFWDYDKIITSEDKKQVDMLGNVHVEAYPATEAVRGEDMVKCVFISEAAFTGLLDDSKVYNALHPNISNIPDADFIMESTPNGKRGFFWELYTSENEYHKLEQPYQLSMGKLLSEEVINKQKANPKIDFEQEYCCKFTTSQGAAFREGDINYIPETINDWSDIV